MRKKTLKSSVILAIFIGNILLTPTTYAASEASYEVTGDNISDDKTGEISIVRTGSSTDIIGLLNEGKKNFNLNSNLLKITADATATNLASTAVGIKNSGQTNISSDKSINATAVGGTISTSSEDADADATASGINNSSQLAINGNTTLQVTATGGNITVKNAVSSADLDADAKAYGIANSGGSTTILGNTAIRVTAIGGTVAATNAASDGDATAYGISNSGGTTTISGDAIIQVTAIGGTVANTSANSDACAHAYGINVSSGAVNMEKNTTVTTTASAKNSKIHAYALYSEKGVININQTSGNPFNVKLTGDVAAKSKEGIINLSLNNSNSFLKGNVISDDSGVVNLTLANNAVWQPVYDNRNGTFYDYASTYSTSKNTISSLNLSGGIVDLSWDDIARTTYRSLNIGTLSGNGGTFRINTDLYKNTGDKITLSKLNSNGKLNIAVAYDSSIANVTQPTTIYAASKGYSPLTLGDTAQAASGVASDYRAYSIMPNFSGANLTSLTLDASSNTKAAASAAIAQEQLLSQNQLNKHLRELRDSDVINTGIWSRMYKGTISNDKYNKVESDYSGISLGYDHSNSTNNGRVFNGVAISYNNGDNSFSYGSGNDKSYELALYHSWQGNDGHYYGFITKGSQINSDYQVTDLSAIHSTATYKTYAISQSAEYGYRKQLSNGWYLEPQLELNYSHLNGASYVTSSGLNIRQDAINRLIGRAGLSVGRKLTNGNHLYSTLSVLHEFSGDANIQADRLNYNQNMGDTWYEIILGASSKLGKNSTGYLNIEKLFGGHTSSNWQVNALCSWNF